MSITLQEFATECHAFLKNDPGPKGRERVRRRLEDARRAHRLPQLRQLLLEPAPIVRRAKFTPIKANDAP